MKVHVRVGEVVVIVEGDDVTYTRRQVRALLAAASMADQLRTPETPEPPVVGFTAHLERLPDDLPAEPGDDD